MVSRATVTDTVTALVTVMGTRTTRVGVRGTAFGERAGTEDGAGVSAGVGDGRTTATRTMDPGTAPTPTSPTSKPAKADVVLDGETVGFASDYNGRWDKLSLAPGPHTIAFQEKGYRTLVVTLDARPGATYVLNDALVPGDGEDHRAIAVTPAEVAPENRSQKPSAIAMGRLRVRVEPADAAVYIDGDYLGLGVELGRIHGALAVAAGTHRLEAVRPGYVSLSRVIEVGDTDVLIVDLILEAQH